MIRLERLRIVSIGERPGRYDLEVERDGRLERAIGYAALLPRPQVGEIAVCNTTAVELGLGTGGVHLVVAIEGRDQILTGDGHAMKLRYTPHQLAVETVEERSPELLEHPDRLRGARIVVCPLHSLLAPVALAVRRRAPDARIAYVMTDQAALALAFSDLVGELRAQQVLAATVTTGQAFGGELEATTLHTGLLAARHVAGADVIVVAMGPGNLGTSSRYGFAAIGAVDAVRAASALDGDVTLCARISFADPRPRHRGVSHHTTTILELLGADATVALPLLPDPAQARVLEEAAAGWSGTVRWIEVDAGDPAEQPLLRSMGRSFANDPAFFLAGTAAGYDAIR